MRRRPVEKRAAVQILSVRLEIHVERRGAGRYAPRPGGHHGEQNLDALRTAVGEVAIDDRNDRTAAVLIAKRIAELERREPLIPVVEPGHVEKDGLLRLPAVTELIGEQPFRSE